MEKVGIVQAHRNLLRSVRDAPSGVHFLQVLAASQKRERVSVERPALGNRETTVNYPNKG